MSARARLPQRLCVSMAAALLCAVALPAGLAQSVSPVITEYSGGAAAGSFDLRNDSLSALVVTLQPVGFAIDREGQGSFHPLESGIVVTLSETSLRLPPQSKRTIYYKASAEAYPAWFSIYASFHGMPKQSGMNVQLQLPHTVYLPGEDRRARPSRGDIELEDLHLTGGVLTGTAHNRSGKVLRIQDVNVSLGRERTTVGGFPLLPGGVRDFTAQLEMKRNGLPGTLDVSARVVARYGGEYVEAVAVPVQQ